MKALYSLFTAALVAASTVLSGCTQAILVRIFNRTDHVISLLERSDGKLISIAPGESAIAPLWGVSKGRQHGFLVRDHDREMFFPVLVEEEDKSKGYASQSFRLPQESLKKHAIRPPEYCFEYSDQKIFALRSTNDERHSRLEPQPPDFPREPNKAPEPTPTSVTSRAFSRLTE